MVDKKDSQDKKKKTLTLSKSVELNKIVDAGHIRQSFSHGRSKTVSVEVKKKRTIDPGDASSSKTVVEKLMEHGSEVAGDKLTSTEIEARLKALQDAQQSKPESRMPRHVHVEEPSPVEAQVEAVEQPVEETPKSDATPASEPSPAQAPEPEEITPAVPENKPNPKAYENPFRINKTYLGKIDLDDDESRSAKKGQKTNTPDRKTLSVGSRKGGQPELKRNYNRMSVQDAMGDSEVEKTRSLASLRRAREKEKQKLHKSLGLEESKKIIREVTIPDVLTVQELSNRMAERSSDVVKTLMKLGVIATINQAIDADTAELVVSEFGHTPKRVSESDIEIGLVGEDDPEALKKPRPPVVTVMGHVDHGKTSLLDTIRKSSIVSHEAGGITQHIGAYQVMMPSGGRITFIDTPGHAAFSQMRARGANVTDIVVLVVAADDGVMEQTVEAINHAKAAQVPIIVAINKIDKPDARPERVKTELLKYDIVLEDMGGDVMSVEISAKNNINIDKLEEIILLQSELLHLGANPNRLAEGVVIEAKIETGRGAVATVLVQRGTLKVGDFFVAGAEWGKVRALVDYNGQRITEAGPSVPVEVLGFDGPPNPGDAFVVAENEAKAKDVVEFRKNKLRNKIVPSQKVTLDKLLSQAKGGKKELAVIIKSDVQGSAEAIASSLNKITENNDEVMVRILHTGIGAINESDITLASTTNAFVVGFNVRANPQAREMGQKIGVEVRYYSIIYNIIDDAKAILGGLLSPNLHEKFLGNAEIREVFNITKVGKVAGCFITEGVVKRGAQVRLLRDNVVIHEGKLKTLKRFKDEIKEAKEGYECGMAFENYNDIRQGDIIECFEVEQVARQL
jgi:translation initiation factor IF-2